ncbi:phage repressor protein CI [Serratia marcescens]|uniref:phage repressor protein CI n=1 Tax=Serratia marcescens TaxID=615 RepID=UPI0039B54CE9
MNLDLDKGGRAAIERMIEAYGCGTKTALAELLGISKGTLSNRYLRDTFPADYVIQCALETGASLRWLATGEGIKFDNLQADILTVPKKKLIDGKLFDASFLMFDKAYLPEDIFKPIVIIEDNIKYLAETKFNHVTDGKWLIKFDDKVSTSDIVKIPGNRIRVDDKKNNISFDCSIDDVTFLALMKTQTTEY